MGDKGQAALTGRTLEHKSGGTTASYTLNDLVVQSSVVDTYVASPSGMAMKTFVKVLAPSLSAQAGFGTLFQETVKQLLRLNIPNTIKIFDYGTMGEYFYTVLEHHKSPTLRRQLEDGTVIDPTLAVETADALALALNAARQEGFYHGLLSPNSIHLSRSRGPLIADFALANLIGGTRLPRALNEDAYLSAFVAPEVLHGAQADAAADQYSLAAVIHAMLTRETPRVGEVAPAAGKFTAVLTRGLARSAGERYGSVSDFAAELRKALTAPEVAQPPPPPVSPPAAINDRTMPEMRIEDLRAAMPPARPPESEVAKPAPPVQPSPASPNPIPAIDRTMPEMRIEDLRAAMPPAPARPPEPEVAKPTPPSANPIPAIDRTMPEMRIEDLRAAMSPSRPPAEPPKAEPLAGATMIEAPMPIYRDPEPIPEITVDDVVPRDEEPDFPRRPSGELPAEKIRSARVDAAPPASSTPAPHAVPPPPIPAPPPEPEEDEFYEEEVPPPPFTPAKTTPPPAVKPEAPHAAPAAKQAPLDATMNEMPEVPPAYSSIPPGSGGYDFGSIAGQSGRGAQRAQIDKQYKTGYISPDQLRPDQPNKPASGSGLTEMLRTVQPATEPESAPKRGRGGILLILLALVLIAVAATIGFVVLKALHVL